MFNLNSDSQQRSEELASFLTSDSGENIDLDMSQVLSSLASSASASPRVTAPMDTSGMVRETAAKKNRREDAPDEETIEDNLCQAFGFIWSQRCTSKRMM